MASETDTDPFSDVLEQLAVAFGHRAAPSRLTDSKQLSDLEHAEVMSFAGMRWQDLTFDHVRRNADAVFWFAPRAFCYFLPGVLAAGIREGRSDTNAYDSLIGMLDRSPEPAYWDAFFTPRWTLLTPAEIDAVAAWVRWLESEQPDAFFDNTYQRVHATLALLEEHALRDPGT